MKLTFSLFFALLFIGYTHAQEDSTDDTLSYSVNLDEFVLTAQYEPTHYKKANHRVDIISKDEIHQRGAVTLDQALLISPAIRINYDPILGATIRMRGISGNNVAILIDGVPVIGRLNGNIDLSQINLQNIERIEIVQGALSNIYGSNSAGGVINIIMKKSQRKKWRAEIGTQIESIGQDAYHASLGYSPKNCLFKVNGRYFNYQQFPVDSLRLLEKVYVNDSTFFQQDKYPFNNKEQWGFGAFLRYNFDEEHNISLSYDNNQETVFDPGVIKRKQFNPYAEEDFFRTNRIDYKINYKKRWKNHFLDISSALNNFDRIKDKKRFYLETSTFDSLRQTSDTTRFRTLFNRAILSSKLSKKWKLISGLNYSIEEGSGDKIINRENSDSSRVQFSEFAPFAEISYEAHKKLKLTASARYITHSIYSSKLTPGFIAKYTPYSNLQFRFSYAQGYRSPSLKELYIEFIDLAHYIVGKTNLQPELSHDYQLTAEMEPSQWLHLSMNAYHTSIKNRIGLLEFESLKYQYANINSYEVYGLQPEIKLNLFESINFTSSASYGYWATNIEAEDTPAFGRVFDMNNNINIKFPKINLGFTINHRHNGKQPIYRLRNEELSVSTVNAFDMIDLSINKSLFKKSLIITAGIKNIINTTSVNISGSSTSTAHGSVGRNPISTGRSFFLNINYVFSK